MWIFYILQERHNHAFIIKCLTNSPGKQSMVGCFHFAYHLMDLFQGLLYGPQVVFCSVELRFGEISRFLYLADLLLNLLAAYDEHERPLGGEIKNVTLP